MATLHRTLPETTPDPLYRPSTAPAQTLKIYHPVVRKRFLTFAPVDCENEVWGVHFATVQVACSIMAVNRSGHFENAEGEVMDIPSDAVLPAGVYYYFLDNCNRSENYPICTDFRAWPFPETVPAAWDWNPTPPLLSQAGSSTSSSVKYRDRGICCISKSQYGIETAHAVPKAEESWLQNHCDELELWKNDELVELPIHLYPGNQFSLRADLHTSQFDDANFVIVPKGEFTVVHFLVRAPEVMDLYHNVIFNARDVTSGRLFLSRFAWSLFKRSKKRGVHNLAFNFHSGDDGDDDSDDNDDNDDDDGGDNDRKQGGRGHKVRKGKGRAILKQDKKRKRAHSGSDGGDNDSKKGGHGRKMQVRKGKAEAVLKQDKKKGRQEGMNSSPLTSLNSDGGGGGGGGSGGGAAGGEGAAGGSGGNDGDQGRWGSGSRGGSRGEGPSSSKKQRSSGRPGLRLLKGNDHINIGSSTLCEDFSERSSNSLDETTSWCLVKNYPASKWIRRAQIEHDRIEKCKKEYIKSHPQVKQHSGYLLPDDYLSDDLDLD